MQFEGGTLAGEKFQVLKLMDELKGRVTTRKFAEAAGLSVDQMLSCVNEIVKTGLIKKDNQRYSITQEGKTALKELASLPEGKEFNFYKGIDRPTGQSARSLKGFRDVLKEVDAEALEFHIYRGDFENWITAVFDDSALVNGVVKLKKAKLTGERLRNGILGLTDARYNQFIRLLT